MQKRHRIGGRRGNKKRTQLYAEQALYIRRPVRLYWSASYHVRKNDTGQIVRRLSIRSTAWQTTPTLMQVEWTLAMLTSAWLQWTYANGKENDGLF